MPPPLKKETKTMKKDDKFLKPLFENVVEHHQLIRNRAFAFYLARCHAHNHGEPMPDPASIGPANLPWSWRASSLRRIKGCGDTG
jgi:hypothetical protein